MLRSLRLPLALFGLALAVRLLATVLTSFPLSEDSAYYVAVAERLASGHGLTSLAIWSYSGSASLGLPTPAFSLWQPLTSLLLAGPMFLFGSSFTVAQLTMSALGALLAPGIWLLARRAWPGQVYLPLAAGLAAAFAPPLVVASVLPDSTIPFALAVLAAALLLPEVLARSSRRGALVIGLVLGLAALARNEAIVFVAIWALLAWRQPGRRGLLLTFSALGLLAVLAPWWLRQLFVFGHPFPGAFVANALFLRQNDVFAFASPPSLARYLAAGPAFWLGSRLLAVGHELGSTLLIGGLPLAPLGLLSLGCLPRHSALRFLLFGALLTLVLDVFFFPVATLSGTFAHSSGPAQLVLLLAAVAGGARLLEALGRRRSWTRPATRLLPGLVLVLSVPLLIANFVPLSVAASAQALRWQAAPVVPGSGPVLSDHPMWASVALGRPALMLPDEPPAAIQVLARHSGADWALVSEDRPLAPALARCLVTESGGLRLIDLACLGR